MADSAPELKRDSTMKATAEEGAEFLKRQGGEDLVYTEDAEKPKLTKDTTIQATVKEAEKILENENIDEDAKTRGDQERIDAAKAESEPPKVPRENTMVATAAEGKEILGDEEVGETRAQTKVIKEAAEVTAGGDAKEENEASLKRTSTMADTIQEGEEFLKKQKTSNGDSETKKEEAPAQEAS
ncbi:putative nucleolin [Apostichopus japonicus]|uniref:Putative nucleolin n=1 Tax=Stichopus japonicus TaxID=307972 RepID=A0A2G8KN50_STIJA|nr:putative nucleolin [Apostichopus japonicus]